MPVIVVRGAAVMGLAIGQLVTDLHQEDGAFFLSDQVLAFLGRLIRIAVRQLLGGYKIDVLRKNLFNVIILDGHVFFRFLQGLVNLPDGFFQIFYIPVFLQDNFFPVPLIHVDGVNIIRILIPADGAHICVEAFADVEAVLLQGVALPFCQGMNDLGGTLILLLDAEGNGALHTVQIVVQSGFRRNEERSGDTQQIELISQRLLEKVFDSLDGYLGVIKTEL